MEHEMLIDDASGLRVRSLSLIEDTQFGSISNSMGTAPPSSTEVISSIEFMVFFFYSLFLSLKKSKEMIWDGMLKKPINMCIAEQKKKNYKHVKRDMSINPSHPNSLLDLAKFQMLAV